jgi:methyl-accepting chemotaxis protein
LVEQASAAAHTLTEQAENLTGLIAQYRLDKGAVEAPMLRSPLPAAGSKAAMPAVERRAASRPFGKKESASRAKQPPERKGAPGDAEVWQEF